MQWGNGAVQALARIPQLTRAELLSRGVTYEMAIAWRDFYVRVVLDNPTNMSAAGRALLMDAAAKVLQ